MTLMTLNFDGDYMHRTAPTVLVSCIVYDAVCLSVLATFMSSPPAHIPGPISLLCVQYNVVIVVHGNCGLSQLMSCLIWCHDLEIDGVLLVVELHFDLLGKLPRGGVGTLAQVSKPTA